MVQYTLEAPTAGSWHRRHRQPPRVQDTGGDTRAPPRGNTQLLRPARAVVSTYSTNIIVLVMGFVFVLFIYNIHILPPELSGTKSTTSLKTLLLFSSVLHCTVVRVGDDGYCLMLNDASLSPNLGCKQLDWIGLRDISFTMKRSKPSGAQARAKMEKRRGGKECHVLYNITIKMPFCM